MTDAIFWRLIWKEYRLQRAFFVAVVVLSIAIQVLSMLGAAFQGASLPDDWIYLVAAGTVALYALGCGATLFATEHESGTFDFQRNLPVPPTKFFVGKLTFALGSMLALAVLVWILAALMSRGVLPSAGRQLEIGCAGAVAALEMLAWGVFFSLVLRQPLLAAILGVATASLLVQTVVPNYGGYQYGHLGFEHYLGLLPQRFLFCLLLISIDGLIGIRWFQGKLWSWRRRAATVTDRPARVAAHSPGDGTWRAMGNLVWQTWRQGRRMLVVCTALYVTLIALPWILRSAGERNSLRLGQDGLEACYWLVPFAAVLGCCVFLFDQTRQQFRFFAERGTRPRLVWLSRQLVWGGAVALGTMAACLYVFAYTYATGELSSAWKASSDTQYVFAMWIQLAIGWLSIVAVAYTAGQVCSMFFRSPILAITFGSASALALGIWSGTMITAGVPWWWSVAPIPLVLLYATWLRTPNWILERSNLRTRALAITSTVVPLGLILVAVIIYRVQEIPVQSPGFFLARFERSLTDAEKAGSELYATVSQEMIPFDWPKETPSNPAKIDGADPADSPPEGQALDFSDADRALLEDEIKWVNANQVVIDKLLKSHRSRSAVFFDPHTGRYYVPLHQSKDFLLLLMASAKLHQARGELDAAWERHSAILYMTCNLRNRGQWYEYRIADDFEQRALGHIADWAAEPGQSADQLRQATGDFEGYLAKIPSRDACIKNDYVLTRQFLLANQDVMNRLALTPDEIRQRMLLMTVMPWEQHRALRLLDLVTHASLQLLAEAEGTLDRGSLPQGISVEDWNRQMPVALVETTPLLGQHVGGLYSHVAVDSEFKQATLRRATALKLALATYRQENGRLPERLEDLREGYLDPIPPDPYTGQSYRYFPNGTAEDTPWGRGAEWRLPGGDARRRVIPEGQPFLWSAGPVIRRLYYLDPAEGRKYLISDDYGNQFRAVTEAEALTRGWAFPLPVEP